MARKGQAPPRREVTRRRLARWQRERRRRRVTTAIGLLVIAVVIAVIVYGVYATVIAPPRQQLSVVNGTSITAADYVKALRLYLFGFYPSTGDIREDPLFILENNELVRQDAAELNIEVTYDEVTQQIKDLLSPEEEEIDKELYQQMLSNIGLSEEEFRWFIAADVLQEKLEEYLVPESAEQVHVQAILVANETAAQVVVDRLDGEDFASLVEEYGGSDLGWLPRGIMSEEFDEVVFSIAIGNVSQPFSTAEGYYIIKVLEKEERALDEDVREQLEASAFAYWLEEQWEEKVDRKVDDEDLEEIYQWAMGQID